MKLTEYLNKNTQPLKSSILEGTDNSADFNNTEMLNESLKDIFKGLKKKFSQVISFVKSVVVKAKNYWLAVWEGSDEENPEYLSAITPFTTAQAYVSNQMNRNKTVVIAPSLVAKATGCKAGSKDAEKLYGSGNSLQYWKTSFKEAEETGRLKPINEVKLHTDDPSAKYNVVDNDELIEDITLTLKNPQLNRLLIYGAPGIGKTAILNQIIKGFNSGKKEADQWQLIVKTLSNETPENFMLPKYVEVDGATRAEDVPKTWLPVYKPTGDPAKDKAASDACGYGLLFIDELSRATPQVLNVILPLINEGVINEWKVGDNWRIICASNRMEDEAYGQTDLGSALSSRFRIVYYEPTAKTWAQWARKQKYISPLLLDWLQLPEKETHSGGKYFYWDPNESGELDSPAKLMCTPRTWDNAMKNLAVYANTGDKEGWDILEIPNRIIARALGSSIPPEAIDSFLAFLEIIRSVGSMEDFTSAVWSGKKPKVKQDVLDKIPFQICQILITSRLNELPTSKEMANLFKWLVSIQNPALASYLLDTIKNVYGGLLEEKFRENLFWIGGEVQELKKQKDEESKKRLKFIGYVFDKVAQSFGLKDITEWPDWTEATEIFAADPKYSSIFSQRDSNGKLLFDKEYN